jgi:hypothetical protein
MKNIKSYPLKLLRTKFYGVSSNSYCYYYVVRIQSPSQHILKKSSREDEFKDVAKRIWYMIACVNSAFDATVEHPIRKTHYTLIHYSESLSRFLIPIPYPDSYPDSLSRSLIQSPYPDPLSRSLIQIPYPDPLSRSLIQIPYPDSVRILSTKKYRKINIPPISRYRGI